MCLSNIPLSRSHSSLPIAFHVVDGVFLAKRMSILRVSVILSLVLFCLDAPLTRDLFGGLSPLFLSLLYSMTQESDHIAFIWAMILSAPLYLLDWNCWWQYFPIPSLVSCSIVVFVSFLRSSS
jgi:hypothetical protein